MVTNVEVTKPAWLQDNTPKTTTKPSDKLTSKDTFLQLLVAQIRNQNPLQPQDGIQFVTQLAQFTGLEQSMQMKDELQAIHKILDAQANTTPPDTTDTGTKETKN